MAHFTHRIRYKRHGVTFKNAVSDEAFRCNADDVGENILRLTSDPNVTDVRIEHLRETPHARIR